MLQRKLHIARIHRAGDTLRALAPIAPELDVGAAAAQIDGRPGARAPSAERETYAAQLDIAAPLVRQKQVAARLSRARETRGERFGQGEDRDGLERDAGREALPARAEPAVGDGVVEGPGNQLRIVVVIAVLERL